MSDCDNFVGFTESQEFECFWSQGCRMPCYSIESRPQTSTSVNAHHLSSARFKSDNRIHQARRVGKEMVCPSFSCFKMKYEGLTVVIGELDVTCSIKCDSKEHEVVQIARPLRNARLNHRSPQGSVALATAENPPNKYVDKGIPNSLQHSKNAHDDSK